VAVTFGCSLVLGAAVAWIGYRCVAAKTASVGADKIFLHLREIIRYRKKMLKAPDRYDSDALESKIATIRQEIEEGQAAAGADFSTHLAEIEAIDVTPNDEEVVHRR